ncbi:MAG TPA: LysR family transcriptional regulator [Candidatus Saccharimonadales bacterium]
MEDRLRKFTALVDTGSFTKAARELHLSQPALSASIAKLERELHAELLVHGSRPLELTDAGRLAYETAQQLSSQTKSLTEQLAALERKRKNLSIGMIDSVANAVFSSENPLHGLDGQADVSIVVNNSRFLLEAVAKGELDLALAVTRSRTIPDGIAAYFVANEPLVLVCHTELAPAMNRALSRGKLPHFIAYDQLSATRRLVAEALRERGVTPHVHFSSTSPEVMLRLVMLRRGASVLPYLLVREALSNGTLSLLGATDGILIYRRISSINKHGQPPHTAADSVRYAVRQALQALDAEASARLRTG